MSATEKGEVAERSLSTSSKYPWEDKHSALFLDDRQTYTAGLNARGWLCPSCKDRPHDRMFREVAASRGRGRRMSGQ